MAKATAKQKLTFDQPTSIPLNKLALHPSNVRGQTDKSSVADLAESIAAHGLLQSLSVRALDSNEQLYGVLAGGRRWRALQLLVKQKRLDKDAPIPCIILTGGVIEAASLAENVDREALHPIDQFKAFKALADQGQGDETIAAAFRVTPAVVRQRLRLANASERLLSAYRAEEITLEQLMAFCLTDDAVRQEHAFKAVSKLNSWDQTPEKIRRMIAESAVNANDKRALFVGLAVYEAAGGVIIRDLFDDEAAGWLQDSGLLNRLVEEKLETEAEKVRAEGWAWVEAAVETSWERKRDFVEIEPEEPALTGEEEEELERLYEEKGDDEDKEASYRITELENKSGAYSDEQKAASGCFVSLNYEGELCVERGLAPREESPIRNGYEAPKTAKTGNGGADKGNGSGLSESLLTELTAYHTLGLRNALAGDHGWAYLAILHALTLDLFYGGYQVAKSCLQIKAQDTLCPSFEGLDSFQAAQEIKQRHEAFKGSLPADAGDLWEHLSELEPAAARVLFAHCVGLTVNAVHKKFGGHGERENAGQLARAVHLDMTDQGFAATDKNFFGRVSKEVIKASIGNEAYGQIATMKKPEMAKAAAKHAQKHNWLPELLRTPGDR